MKKIISIFAAILLAITAFAGCKVSDDGGSLSSFKNRPNEVVVYYSANAYGKDWITEIARKYMTDHNDDTYINIKRTVMQTTELSKIEAGTANGDLYLLDCHMEDQSAWFADLSDVYSSYPLGEEAKTIDQKINPAIDNIITNNGTKKYIMPKTDIIGGNNFVYNKTVWNKVYPSGRELPRTTEELVEVGNEIKNKAYLLVGAFDQSTAEDSAVYMFKSWFAQLLGVEAYEQFLQGRYYDEAQEKYVFDEKAPTAYTKNQWAVESYFDILQSIYDKGNGLLHKYSSEMTAMDAEAALAGFGYAGIDNKPVVFMVCGAYLEQEMNFLLQDQKASGNPQEIGYMQMPVASGIIERTPTITNDGILRQVITYVDKIAAGESATKPAGVSDADIEIIAEARSICGSYVAGGMVIPKYADNIAGAKEFMKYLASDEAAIIAAKHCNGMNILPFGYQASDEEIGFNRTAFMKQAMAISTRVKYVATSDSQEYHFSKISKFGPAADGPWTYLGPLYNGTNKYTATSFYNAQYEKFSLNWKMYVDTYKAAGGSTAN